MKIVGLVGPRGAGKDTTYDILKDIKKANDKMSFALPLKRICAKVFKLTNFHLNDPVGKEHPFETPIVLTTKNLRAVKFASVEYLDPMTADGKILYNPNKASIAGLEHRELRSPRELLQVVGTDYIRKQMFQDWHLHAAFNEKTLKEYSQNGVYCVTDIRFVNEYQFLKEKFGDDFTCYYIERPEAEKKLQESVKNGSVHQSELETQKIRELLPESNVIKNNGTMEDLTETLKALDIQKPAPKPKASKFKFRKK